jgi:hypothetical protein
VLSCLPASPPLRRQAACLCLAGRTASATIRPATHARHARHARHWLTSACALRQDHPSTLSTCKNLSNLCRDQGELTVQYRPRRIDSCPVRVPRREAEAASAPWLVWLLTHPESSSAAWCKCTASPPPHTSPTKYGAPNPSLSINPNPFATDRQPNNRHSNQLTPLQPDFKNRPSLYTIAPRSMQLKIF